MSEKLNNHEQQIDSELAAEWSDFPPFDPEKAQAARDAELASLEYDETLYASPSEYLMAHTQEAKQRNELDSQIWIDEQGKKERSPVTQNEQLDTVEGVQEQDDSSLLEGTEDLNRIGLSPEETKFTLGLAEKNIDDGRALFATVRGSHSLEELAGAVVRLSESDRNDFGVLLETLASAREIENAMQMNIAVASESEKRCATQLDALNNIRNTVLTMNLPPMLKSGVMTRVQDIENRVGAIYRIVSGNNKQDEIPGVSIEKRQQDDAEQREILAEDSPDLKRS